MIGLEKEQPKKTQKQVMSTKESQDIKEEKIRIQVKKALNHVDNISYITINNLWDNRYRVNAWCTHMVECDVSVVEALKIDYSYFLHVAEDGKITKSNPELGE